MISKFFFLNLVVLLNWIKFFFLIHVDVERFWAFCFVVDEIVIDVIEFQGEITMQWTKKGCQTAKKNN
jgi:hypothetical protein